MIKLLILCLLLCGCTTIKLFPDELNIYGSGSKSKLSQILELMKKNQTKNTAVSIVFWDKIIGYKYNSMEKSWNYGISQTGNTCKEAIRSSLDDCAKNAMKIKENPFHKEDFGGCFVIAIKCKNLKNELNFHKKIDFLD